MILSAKLSEHLKRGGGIGRNIEPKNNPNKGKEEIIKKNLLVFNKKVR